MTDQRPEDEIDPDLPELEMAERQDDAIPTHGYHMLPVVAIGGSAGSIGALHQLLQHTPPGSGLAFVVVVHLSPDHESELAGMLQKSTRMPVVQVRETVRMQAETVYVIPPRKAMRTVDNQLQLLDLPAERQRHVVVDTFFRALAESHGPHATAVVLSGGDGDGAIGIKRIKERGGLTIAQEPDEAEVSGMPRTAVNTGMVDWVLPIAEIAPRIVQYHRNEYALRLPPEAGPQIAQPGRSPAADESTLREVLGFLRMRTGRDFSYYKRATILRRIGRRMQVNGVAELPDYLACLRTRPGEAGALLQDLLISVTNFFRDGDCFTALQAHVASLFRGKSAADPVRVWVSACATGEEAYSIAMLLSEHARALEVPPPIQIFATDLDDEAIRVAREGVYPATIEADVSEERLRRFFVKEHRGYRVRREVREMVLFAVHDVLKDSPFSKLDLITCRNLLIYLGREAQTRVFETFHFALLPAGMLFLGASESVEDGSALFSVVDKKHRLYMQRSTPRIGMPLRAGPGTLALALEAQNAARTGPVVSGAARNPLRTGTLPPTMPDLGGRVSSWAEAHFRLLEHVAPPSLLVDAEHEILHLSPSAGRYLQHGGGEPSRNLLRVVHPALRIELRAALFRAAQNASSVDLPVLEVDLGGDGAERVAVQVTPLPDVAPGFLLVLFRSVPEGAQDAGQAVAAPPASNDSAVHHLDRELERLKSHLRDTVEQYEASTEELKASNEELQAMNEELRSATEELETSREELQSINEELTTVNQELKSKVDELGHANSDMHNLMDATAIATVFLDRELRITRFTPSAVALFNLIPTDVGRPLSDLTSHLDYPRLGSDAARVLERLAPIEHEVDEEGGNRFLVRMLPYRTLDDHIGGVVLTFVDITERKRGQEALRQSEERFSAIAEQATVGLVQATLEGRISFVNRSYCAMLGYDEKELLGRNVLDLVAPDDRPRSAELFARLPQGEAFQLEKRSLCKDGSLKWTFNSVSLLTDAQGLPGTVLVVSTDISERKHAEDALRNSEERLRLVLENATEFAIFSTDLERRITGWNTGAQRLLGYQEADAVGRPLDMLFTEEDQAAGAPQREVQAALRDGRALDDRLHRRQDGSIFWASGVLMPMHGPSGKVVGFVKVMRDQSATRRAQEEIERSQAEMAAALQEKEAARATLEAADSAKGHFLAVLSHELRNPLASISGAAKLLLAEQAEPATRQRAAGIVDRQSLVVKNLLDDLLDVSRLQLGRLGLRRVPVLLEDVVRSALETARPAIDAGRHSLAVELPSEPVVLDADPLRMSQVLSNLLTNAAKYTPDGGRIGLEARRESSEQLAICVSDNGIGLEAQEIDALFEMFAQGGAIGERTGHGLGIGLALVRSIVALHGGAVQGESAGRGLGCRFTVRLPLPQDMTPEQALRQAAPPEPAAAGLQQVLLVDDNEDAAWSLAMAMEMNGRSVTTAATGSEALALAAELRPHAVVLDIGLPDLSGYEVARRMRESDWGRQAVLVAATGWGQENDRQAAREAGFDGHLVKPVDVAELLALLDQLRSARRA
ncbi:CheR family methyltransferase [Pseudorhodoferax soli]|uniref:histidine kinase n=1 Tax=Pseudorhodoferax soli TaxID=545864 RepID=A0A368XWN5_9BURK|nr:CheR family methyltransferase [Pseudorhodoferax soli]RCW72490.1 two-component system CheB/CheR fusion protein [Pseudorhodoferax soli]